MKLRGRIDRIDATEIDGKNYVRIVDYKSSSKQSGFDRSVLWIVFQMMTYLDVALENADEWLGVHCGSCGSVVYACP